MKKQSHSSSVRFISGTSEFNQYKPTYTISSWTKPSSMVRRLSHTIVLPSVIECGSFTLKAADGDNFLELT